MRSSWPEMLALRGADSPLRLFDPGLVRRRARPPARSGAIGTGLERSRGRPERSRGFFMRRACASVIQHHGKALNGGRGRGFLEHLEPPCAALITRRKQAVRSSCFPGESTSRRWDLYPRPQARALIGQVLCRDEDKLPAFPPEPPLSVGSPAVRPTDGKTLLRFGDRGTSEGPAPRSPRTALLLAAAPGPRRISRPFSTARGLSTPSSLLGELRRTPLS